MFKKLIYEINEFFNKIVDPLEEKITRIIYLLLNLYYRSPECGGILNDKNISTCFCDKCGAECFIDLKTDTVILVQGVNEE